MPTPSFHQSLTGIDKPHANDVLCGRGVTTNRHAGNESFRRLVGLNKELYVSSTKKQKMKISRSVVEAVRALDPPGRFLEKDPTSGKWFDIGDKKAIEKTSQALRDGAASLRKQLSQDLSDPEFLSAVFDADGVQTETSPSPAATTPAAGKKKLITKSHRRVKSTPVAAVSPRSKVIVKKSFRGPEIPMSPRGSRQSICVVMHGKPPHSPNPTSPRSSGGSPRPPSIAGLNPNIGHRRGFSQDSFPVQSTRLESPVSSGSLHYIRQTQSMQTRSFEYNEPSEHHRPPPIRFRSPSPHHYHSQPMSPAYPPSPYGGRPYRPSGSPRWSPHSSGYTSPHPYYHEDYQRRHSPEHQPRPPLSPRDQFHQPRHPGHSVYGPYQNTLAVPALGGESLHTQHNLPMAPPRQYFPHSPRHVAPSSGIQSNSQRLPSIAVEFTPPQTFSRRVDLRSHSSTMQREGRQIDEEMHDAREESVSSVTRHDNVPFDEHVVTSSSPSTVADMTKSNASEKQSKPETTTSSSYKITDFDDYDDKYPSDEDLDPADERLSPLPFSHPEDPSSLMELPENILTMPISPCGPHDGEAVYRMPVPTSDWGF